TKTMTLKPSLILLFALTFALPVQAEIFGWIDADGESHFSEPGPNNKDQVAPQVDLYVTSWCPYCKKAIAFLDKNKIAYKKYDIEEDLYAADRKKTLAPEYRGVPLAVINGVAIRGFSEARYQQALPKK
ncbi:MAG: glutaredoxin family protein, partial [Methylobacter sp.]